MPLTVVDERRWSARGVSLIELLVSIGVIGLLLSLLLPTLRSVRAASGEAASLANLKSIQVTLELYVAGHGERFPCLDPDPTVTYQTNAGLGFRPGDPWHAMTFWPFLMSDVAPFSEHVLSWLSPGGAREPPSGEAFVPDYFYSNSFVAPVEVWTNRRPPQQPAPDWFTAPRAHAVRTPAQKVVFYDAAMAYNRRQRASSIGPFPAEPIPMGFVDGHATACRIAQASEPFPNVFNQNWWSQLPLHNTPEGVAGRDY